jgi:hypothetical protein
MQEADIRADRYPKDIEAARTLLFWSLGAEAEMQTDLHKCLLKNSSSAATRRSSRAR